MNILILDMDGTVRIKKGGTPGDLEAGFISHPQDQEIIPGAAKAIESYAREGWLIVGASNQGGVAAGKKSLKSCFEEQLQTINLVPQLHKIYFCPDYEGKQLGIVGQNESFYSTLNNFEWSLRKPEPGMINFILMGCDPDRVLFVGDRPEDEQAADKAGIDFQWAKDWWK